MPERSRIYLLPLVVCLVVCQSGPSLRAQDEPVAESDETTLAQQPPPSPAPRPVPGRAVGTPATSAKPAVPPAAQPRIPYTPPAAPATPPGSATEAPFSGLGGGLSGGEVATPFLNMLGDQAPLSRLQTFAVPSPPGIPNPPVPPIPGKPNISGTTGAALLPSVRGFKIAENQSPQPQDRIYYSFNFYDDVNKALNSRFNYPIYGIQVYREILGFEKTFWDKRASIGLRLPIDTLSAGSPIRGFGGTSTAVGDLAVILKYAFYQNPENGSLASYGLLLTTPTGPTHFAGFNHLTGQNNFAFQPFVGFIKNMGRAYLHGFSSIDVPTNPNDVTIFYNDIGLGYYLFRADDPNRFLSMIVPTVETHINTPLNHRDVFNPNSVFGTPDVVDFTFGVNIGLGRRGLLSLGYVEPLTGPRPFSGEVLALFNIRF